MKMEEVQSANKTPELHIKEEVFDENSIDIYNEDIDPLGERSEDSLEVIPGHAQQDCRDENLIARAEADSSVPLRAGIKIEDIQYAQADSTQHDDLSYNTPVTLDTKKQSATTFFHCGAVKGNFQLPSGDFVFEFTVISNTESACVIKNKILNNYSTQKLKSNMHTSFRNPQLEHVSNTNVGTSVVNLGKIKEENSIECINIESGFLKKESDYVFIGENIISKELVNKTVNSLNKESHNTPNDKQCKTKTCRKRKQSFTQQKDEDDDDNNIVTSFHNVSNILDKIPDNCCKVCYTFVNDKSQLKTHKKEKHNPLKKGSRKPETFCDMCFEGFVCVRKRKEHMTEFSCIEKICRFCDVQLESRIKYEKHYLDYHSNEHFCPFCDRLFVHNEVKKKAHYLKHTSFKLKVLFCFHCKGRFVSQRWLKNHKCRAAKKLSCERCNFAFKNFIEHDEHIEVCKMMISDQNRFNKQRSPTHKKNSRNNSGELYKDYFLDFWM